MHNKIPINAYVMIIGAMKCGTSSLFEYLKTHPAICPAFEKEPMFFAKNQLKGLQIENYEDLFDYDASTHRYAMEASTAYTKYPEEKDVAKKIHAYGIRPKFIYVVRDPFERIESQYRFEKRSPNFNHLEIDHAYFVNYSDYYMQLEKFTEYFSKDDILIIDFNDIKANPEKPLKKIYEFLQIDPDHFPEKYTVENKTIVKNNIEIFIQTKFRNTLKLIPVSFKNIVRKRIRKLAKPEIRKLNEEERNKIHRHLYGNMLKFREAYGVDVSKWGFHV